MPAASLGGLEDVDLWIGGLAEKTMPFGGMLGSTFNFVFEVQMESLQNGDRFYYLQRLDGLHLFGEMESNTFAAHDHAQHRCDASSVRRLLDPGPDPRSGPTRQYNDLDGDGTLEQRRSDRRRPPHAAGHPQQSVDRRTRHQLSALHRRRACRARRHRRQRHADRRRSATTRSMAMPATTSSKAVSATTSSMAATATTSSPTWAATTTSRAATATTRSTPGRDSISCLRGDGKDFIVLGSDMGSEVFGGEGNDFILGNNERRAILGNEGDDWIENGAFDGAPGDNFDEIFARDGIGGNDVLLGDGGFDEFIGEGGDDIMVGSLGRGKMAGMSGFDWATYKDNRPVASTPDFLDDYHLRRGPDRSRRMPRCDGSKAWRACPARATTIVLTGCDDTAADARARQAAPTRLPRQRARRAGHRADQRPAGGARCRA